LRLAAACTMNESAKASSSRAQLADPVAEVGLVVEPGARDLGRPGDGAEGDCRAGAVGLSYAPATACVRLAKMRGERVFTWVAVAGASWLALYAALTLAAQRFPSLSFPVGDVLYLVPIVCAAVLSLFAAGRTVGRLRVAWRLLVVSNVLWLGGEVAWVVYDVFRPGGAPVPSVADVGWMLRYVVALAAVLIGLRVGSLLRGASALLDAMLVAVGVAALCWRLFISGLIPGTWTYAEVTTLAYAVFAVSIMSVVIGVLLSGHRRVPLSMLLVCAAFGVSAVGDMGFSYLVVANSYSAAFSGASWWNMFWEAAAVLMCLAAVLAARQREGAGERPELDRDVAVLPALVAVITVGGLALADSARAGRLNTLTLGVAGLMVAGLLVRQSMALRDRTRMADTLHRAAMTDGLTALYNRRFMEELLRIEAERAVRNRSPLSVIMIDLDRFKNINDEYGHAAGDAVLAQTADRLRHAVRSCDVTARYGGEEFVCLLPDTSEDTALEVAEQLRVAVCSTPAAVTHGSSAVLTASLGVATVEPGDRESTVEVDLLVQADQALYRAKASGRNQVVGSRRPAPPDGAGAASRPG
jgi:two-component system cell cycle response regulator